MVELKKIESLGDYFSHEHIEYARTLKDVEAAIIEMARTFDLVKSNGVTVGANGWPYEIRDGQKPNDAATKKLSFSTHAMIEAALARLNTNANNHLASTSYSTTSIFPKQKIKFKSSVPDDISKWIKKTEHTSKQPSSRFFYSESSGSDDIASLCWTFDLLRAGEPTDSKIIIEIISHVQNVASIIERTVSKSGISINSVQNQLFTLKGNSSADHKSDKEKTDMQSGIGASSLQVLRFARLIRAIDFYPSMNNSVDKSKIRGCLKSLGSWFETKLLVQLSFGEIPDSRFDPAEVALALEGLLITNPSSVSESLFNRSMQVLESAQEANAYWRAETPLRTTTSGEIQLPLSVESAQAVLSSLALYDAEKLHNTTSVKYLPMVQRYWRWLKSRKIKLRFGDHDITGWHSEHVNDLAIIHLWETSQVLCFLVSFRDFLMRQMGRRSLELAGVISEGVPTATTKIATNIAKNNKELSLKHGNHEDPDSAYPVGYCKQMDIYKQLSRDFVHPHIGSSDPSNWSAILYGPPGTGKSTIAKDVAAMIGIPYIQLSVSDLLERGPAEMEARAKRIFQMLELQPKSVVLFDEFDPFLLDRDSDFFKKQESQFQLMTNGMLPKLQDLRASKRVIFFLATNYIERLDPAITRRGRFDVKYCVLPLGKSQRSDTYAQIRADNSPVVAHLKSDDEKRAAQKEREKNLKLYRKNGEKKSKDTVFFGYGDLRAFAEQSDTDASANRIEPSVRPSVYTSRFRKHSTNGEPRPIPIEKTPYVEFVGMLFLELEAGFTLDEITNRSPEAIKAFCQSCESNNEWGREMPWLGECLIKFSESNLFGGKTITNAETFLKELTTNTTNK